MKKLDEMSKRERKTLLMEASEEIQNICNFDPPLEIAKTEEKLISNLKEAYVAGYQDEDNPADPEKELSQEALEVFTQLGCYNGQQEQGEPEEQAEEVDDLAVEVEEAKTIEALKKIVKANDEFESLREGLGSYTSKTSLKKLMLKVLSGEVEVKSATRSKTTTKGKSTKGSPSKSKESTPPKSKKGKGIIATIVELVEKAPKTEGVTKEKILETLVKEFPDRDPDAMQKTIQVQVPNRITRERFEVGKTTEGGYFKKK